MCWLYTFQAATKNTICIALTSFWHLPKICGLRFSPLLAGAMDYCSIKHIPENQRLSEVNISRVYLSGSCAGYSYTWIKKINNEANVFLYCYRSVSIHRKFKGSRKQVAFLDGSNTCFPRVIWSGVQVTKAPEPSVVFLRCSGKLRVTGCSKYFEI